jgi:hypothetical protein
LAAPIGERHLKSSEEALNASSDSFNFFTIGFSNSAAKFSTFGFI